MPLCCVPQCTHRSESHPHLSFYRFPRNVKRRKQWLKAIRCKDFEPTECMRICSWHFLLGKDAGPNQFAWNKGKYFNFPSPEKKQRCKKTPARPASHPESHRPTESQPDVNNPLLLLADTALFCNNSNVKSTCKSVWTDNDVVILQAEKDLLKSENEKLKKEFSKNRFSFRHIEESKTKVQYYTGLPDATTVHILCSLLERFPLQYHNGWVVVDIPLLDQLLMTLMKLRLNLGHEDLATRFACSRATVTNIFYTIVSALSDILYVGMMDKIPSRSKNTMCMPGIFDQFPNCRIILDCTEFSVDNTEQLNEQCILYSNYKGRTTLKALVGIAPNGAITFVSDMYGGSVSDKAITLDCGILQKLEEGDMILADKGFIIQDILPQGISLNTPSVLRNGRFTQSEAHNNKIISSARIHIERAIQRIKIYSILNHIPHQFKDCAGKILKACVGLANLQTPIIREINVEE